MHYIFDIDQLLPKYEKPYFLMRSDELILYLMANEVL